VLPQIGQVAEVPSVLGSMNVAQPLVEQNSRRAAADRRSLRCAADLWLNPEGVKERDNIRVSLSGKPPAGLVRGSLCDECPLDDGTGRSGSLLGICASRASVRLHARCVDRIPCTEQKSTPVERKVPSR